MKLQPESESRMANGHDHRQSGHGVPKQKLVLIGFLAVAGFFLFTEHRAHLFGFLPYLLLLACPLMHLFHHGGHGNHQDDKGDRQ
jgi:hypothetical protein